MTTRRRWSIVAIAALALGAGVAAILLKREASQTGVTEAPPAGLDAPAAATPEVVSTASPEPVVVEAEMPAVAQPAGEGRVYGTVTFPADAPRGLPVTVKVQRVDTESFVVVYPDTPPVRAQADAAGAYEITGLAWGEYVVFAEAPGYTMNGYAFLAADRTKDEVNLALVPGGAISGRVVNESREPVRGVQVFVAGWNIGGQTRNAPRERALASLSLTGEDGAFTVGNLRLSLNGEPGYRLAVKAESYATLLTDYLKAGTSGVELTLAPGVAVAGQLIRDDNDEPLSDKELVFVQQSIALEQNITRTDAEGFFFFANLTPGSRYASLSDDELVLTPETAAIEIAPENANDLVLRAAAGARVAGRAYETKSGDGVGNIEIYCNPTTPQGTRRTTVTHSDGTYVFAGLVPGSYRIVLNKPEGYAWAEQDNDERQVLAKLGESITGIDFMFLRGLRILGHAVDSEDKPLAGQYVQVNEQGTGRGSYAVTEANGSFVVAGFDPNMKVRLQSNRDDLALLQILPSGEDLTFADRDITGVKLIFGAGASISGIVVDTDGRPQAGIELRVSPKENKGYSGANATSGPDGAITFAHVGPGEYQLMLGQDGMYRMWTGSGTTVIVPEKGDVTGQRFVVPAKGGFTISGRVTDVSGKPIAGASISFEGENILARTDATGAYAVPDLHDRAYPLIAMAAGFTPSESISAYGGDSGIDFVLRGLGSIEGRVVSAQTGEPIPAYRIRARLVRWMNFYDAGGSYTDVVDAQGRFRLTNVQDGTTVIDLKASGFGDTPIQIPAVAGGENRQGLALRINAEAKLSGRVVNLAGEPVARAQVAAYGESTVWNAGATVSTEKDGSFQLEAFSPGPIKLYVEHDDYPAKAMDFVLSAGDHNQINIVLSNGGSIEGIMTLDGTPVADQRVSARSNGYRSSDRVKTDKSGYYRLDGLPTGTAELHASLSLEGVRNKGKNLKATVQDGMVTRLNIEFISGTGTIEGTVYARPGEPVSDEMHLTAWIRSSGSEYFNALINDGKYRFDNLPAGEIMLHADSETYGRKQVALSLAEGQTLHRDIVMSGGTRLDVQVAWDEDKDHWATVYLFAGKVEFSALTEDVVEGPSQQSGQSGVIRGLARFDKLEPGTYTVLTVKRLRNVAPEADRYSGAQWTVQTIEVNGEQDLTLQVSV